MSESVIPIKFVIGSRKLYAAQLRLMTVSVSLEELLAEGFPSLPPLAPDSDGYRFLSVPPGAVAALRERCPGYLLGGRQDYSRRYITMDGSFEDYLASFSSKTRSTLKRKQRKLADLSGGILDIEEFTQADQIERFFAEAIPLSRQTYQSRLLDAGLPEDPDFISQSKELARQDRLRAYLLRLEGKVAAYLYLPVEDQTLVYAYLGYDPDLAQTSPGTVLQLAALERLFAEQRFRYFDFTEGEGAHKQMFSTGAAEACSFFLLRPGMNNRFLLGSLGLFDKAVSGAKRLADRVGVAAALRRKLRR